MVDRLLLVILAVPFFLFAGPAASVTIGFEATNLPDLVPGQDLYRYSYTLSAFPYPADFGFSISFDRNLYTSLESPPPAVGLDWDIISIQPDPGLPDDGLYDALALIDSPTRDGGFVIDFIWLGLGAPGSQSFVVHDASFATVESGQTLPVPEPTSLVLIGVGLAVLARRRSGISPLPSPSHRRSAGSRCLGAGLSIVELTSVERRSAA